MTFVSNMHNSLKLLVKPVVFKTKLKKLKGGSKAELKFFLDRTNQPCSNEMEGIHCANNCRTDDELSFCSGF